MAEGCQFKITRGMRINQTCRRPIYRKMSTNLCLQHFRAMEEAAAQQHLKETTLAPCASGPEPAMDKPLSPLLPTYIDPTPQQDEILAYGGTEELTETLLDMLVELKKLHKSGKKVQ